jgi:hypothetical protein
MIRELGVRDRIPVVQKPQIVYIEAGESGLRVWSRVLQYWRAKAAL